MLQGRLTLLAAATMVVAGCAGADGSDRGAIRENVIEPGITAIAEDAPAAACASDASSLRAAIESYTLLEGAPPADEQALIDAELLREASAGWDVADGELVAAADGPCRITEVEIVTDTEPLPTGSDPAGSLDADEVYAEFDQLQIDSVGGPACARELAGIVAAAENFLATEGVEPVDIDELLDAGYLTDPPALWVLDGAQLVPAADSGCADLS